MAVYQFKTSDIKKAVLRNCGETDDGTSFYDQNGQVMALINRAYLAVLSGGDEFDIELSKPWVWAKEPKPGVFVLQPKIEFTSVAIVNGSNKVTFATAPAVALLNYWIRFSDRSEWFRVLAHSKGSTIATIDAPYTGDTAADIAATAILIDYTLSPTNGILRLVHPFVLYKVQGPIGDMEDKLYFMDQAALLKNFPLRLIDERIPNYFCETYRSPQGALNIRLNSFPHEQTKVEYEYIKVPDMLTDGSAGTVDSEPVIPLEYRDALTFAASYFLCVEKNDSRIQQYLQQVQSKLKSMQKSAEKEKTQLSSIDRGRLIPRQDRMSNNRRWIQQGTT